MDEEEYYFYKLYCKKRYETCQGEKMTDEEIKRIEKGAPGSCILIQHVFILYILVILLAVLELIK